MAYCKFHKEAPEAGCYTCEKIAKQESKPKSSAVIGDWTTFVVGTFGMIEVHNDGRSFFKAISGDPDRDEELTDYPLGQLLKKLVV